MHSMVLNSMKVLHHTNRFLPVSQTFVIDIIDALNRHSISTLVFTHELVKNEDTKHIEVKDISYNSHSPFFKKILNAYNQLRGFAHNTKLKIATRELTYFAPDVIHCHFGTAAYFNFSLQQYAKTNIPVLISFHGFDIFKANDLFHKYQPRLTRLIQGNALCTCPSKFLSNHLIEKFNIDPQRVVVVPNGFNEQLFTPHVCAFRPSDTLRISHIGRFEDLKGQRYLIEAVAQLKKAGHHNIHLTLIGDGTTRENMQNLAQKLNISDQITFTGAIRHQEVAKHLKHSHLYVHPSFTLVDGTAETFGVAILEALASGKPVIITDSGGMAEILPDDAKHKYARVVKQKSAQAIANAIIDFMHLLPSIDQDEFLEFRDAVMLKNNTEKSANMVIDCYKKLLSFN